MPLSRRKTAARARTKTTFSAGLDVATAGSGRSRGRRELRVETHGQQLRKHRHHQAHVGAARRRAFYDKDGDLLAAFTGRWDPSDLPDIRSSDEVTVKWTTNSYDENAIGYLEDVAFQATSSSTVRTSRLQPRRRRRRRRRGRLGGGGGRIECDTGEYDSVRRPVRVH